MQPSPSGLTAKACVESTTMSSQTRLAAIRATGLAGTRPGMTKWLTTTVIRPSSRTRTRLSSSSTQGAPPGLTPAIIGLGLTGSVKGKVPSKFSRRIEWPLAMAGPAEVAVTTRAAVMAVD